MQKRKLTSRDARLIAELEKIVYPLEFMCGEDDFFHDLQQAEERGENYSIGYFNERDELVAYLVAYVVRSKRCKDRVVYGSDVAVHPNLQRRGYGGRLILEVLVEAGKDGLACEGECRKASYLLLKNHPDTLARYGYRLAQSRRLPQYNAGEDHWWIRLERLEEGLNERS